MNVATYPFGGGQPLFHEFFLHLLIKIFKGRGISNTPQGEIHPDGKFIQTDEAYWLRIKVTNDGKNIARTCRAHITQLSRINRDGTVERMDNQDALIIRWAIINETVIDLPKGVNQFSGICYTKKSAANRLIPNTPREAIRLERVWGSPGTFELRIVVTAENAEHTCKLIRFEWGGSWGTLKPLA
ncbi:MAG: hypothetical protein U1E42_10250 [Rhodospirillales bacterium]